MVGSVLAKGLVRGHDRYPIRGGVSVGREARDRESGASPPCDFQRSWNPELGGVKEGAAQAELRHCLSVPRGLTSRGSSKACSVNYMRVRR